VARRDTIYADAPPELIANVTITGAGRVLIEFSVE
jgi:uncharacterized lipoprotein YbaY